MDSTNETDISLSFPVNSVSGEGEVGSGGGPRQREDQIDRALLIVREHFNTTASQNMTAEEMLAEWRAIIQKYFIGNNRNLPDNVLVFLCIAYGLLIILGTIGNGLVCMAVIRNPAMRTARNVFIINLAISDLLLCIFTMPFTLMDIATKFWPLGKSASLYYGSASRDVFSLARSADVQDGERPAGHLHICVHNQHHGDRAGPLQGDHLPDAGKLSPHVGRLHADGDLVHRPPAGQSAVYLSAT